MAAACLATRVLSSAVWYAIEHVVMRRLARARFALLLALQTATPAIVGALILGQIE